MTQKLFGLCAAAALLFAFATANVASAGEPVVAPTGCCPCVATTVVPCQFACPPVRTWHHTWRVHPLYVNPCVPCVTYRVGPFGGIRPVVTVPVYRPVYVVPRVHRVHRWHYPAFVW